MHTCLRRGCLAALVVVGLLLCQPSKAQAQPQLIGRWTAALPQGVYTAYDFGPGQYMSSNVWRGPYTLYVADQPVACGTYELRIFSGTQATLGLRDGVSVTTDVAIIDLAARIMIFKNTTYKP